MKASLRILISAVALGSAAIRVRGRLRAADRRRPAGRRGAGRSRLRLVSARRHRLQFRSPRREDDFDFRDFNPVDRHLQSGRLRYSFAGRSGHLGCRLRLQFHGHDPRRLHGRRVPRELRRHHVERDALRGAFRPSSARPAARTTVPTAAALSFMVNGYVDLGTYVGFTPYVGGGLGYTYIDWGTLSGLQLLRRRRALPGRRHAARQLRARRRRRAGGSPMPRWPALPTTSRRI